MGAVVIAVLVSMIALVVVCLSDARQRRRDASMTTFASSIAALERIAAERREDRVHLAAPHPDNVQSLDDYRRLRSAQRLQKSVRFVDGRPRARVRMAARPHHERKVQSWQLPRTTAMTPT